MAGEPLLFQGDDFSHTDIDPPVEPMLAKLLDALPPDGGSLYEPKWDGFRAIVFRGGDDVCFGGYTPRFNPSSRSRTSG